MAATRLGLSATPRPSRDGAASVVASLAQWQWTPLSATVRTDVYVTTTAAQWSWTPLSATVIGPITPIYGWNGRARIGSVTGTDKLKRIGSATAVDKLKRIGSSGA